MTTKCDAYCGCCFLMGSGTGSDGEIIISCIGNIPYLCSGCLEIYASFIYMQSPSLLLFAKVKFDRLVGESDGEMAFIHGACMAGSGPLQSSPGPTL
ncbi:hypothetical protein ACFX2G_036672 [Malus domestica]